jgi:hypothetical protein
VGVKLTELCYIIASGTGQGRSLLPNNSPPFGLPVPLISSAVEAVDVSKKKLTPLQRARLEHLAQVGSFFLSEDIKATLEEDARSASTAATRAPASERVQLALTHLSPETLHLPGKALAERVNDWLKKNKLKAVSYPQIMRASGRWRYRGRSQPGTPSAPQRKKSLLELAKEFLEGKHLSFFPQAETTGGQRKPPKQEIARRALSKVYPAGVPRDESNQSIIHHVVRQLKEDGEWPKNDRPQPFSYDTILRAADRRR